MSVTITIEGNREHLRVEAPELIKTEQVECWCIRGPEDVADPFCPTCHGRGVYPFEVYPYELNLANGNFHTVFSALGFDVEDYCGSCSGEELLAALRATPRELAERTDHVIEEPGRAKVIAIGIDEDRTARYWLALRLIGSEAKKRGKDIVWG